MYFFRKKIITREDGKAYLIRWTLFHCRFFSIKLHTILVSDDACLHDHPWAFLSFIIKGGYVEYSEKGSRLYHPGNILFRKAKWKHRLEVHQPAITVVITFRKVRLWGFWTRNGFVPFYNYEQGSNQCE